MLIGFIGVSCILNDVTPNEEAEPNVGKLKSVLLAVGVPGPISLASFGSGANPFSNIACVGRDGKFYTGQLSVGVQGRQKISIPARRDDFYDFTYPRISLHDALMEQHVRSWVTALAGKQQFQLNWMKTDPRKKQASASFTILYNGRQFFPVWDTYGYLITFTLPEGRFVSLQGSENPPPVEMRPPKLTANQAESVARGVLTSRL